MGTNIDDITDLVSDLNIAGNASPPLHSTVVSIQDAIQTLVQSTDAVTLQIESLQSKAGSFGGLSVADVGLLHDGTNLLTRITQKLQSHVSVLNDATEESIITYLKSLGEHSPAPSSRTRSSDDQSGSTLSKMLSHFDKQIKEIVRVVLNDTGNRDLLLKVAEECYNQVTCSSGKLDANNYFHRQRSEQRSEAQKKETHSWRAFWVRVLNNVPGGPTLFYAPAGFPVHSRDVDTDVPQYLFRTYDEASSGWNSACEITSIASDSSSGTSRIDILALEPRQATGLLHDHLNKPCFSGSASDNLMSWTSSFLFVIQYAIWRFNTRGCSPSDVKICMIETSKFPMGQFTRDICLLKRYHATARQLNGAIKSFFDFRLGNEDYYNGEFLSQGRVSIIDRSCVVSLEEMIQAGLFRLYPEFGDSEGGKTWAKRTLYLRKIWSAEQDTTDGDIELALGVGRKCFPQFEPLHVACVLLAFKNRKHAELDLESKSFPYSRCHRQRPTYLTSRWIQQTETKMGE